MPLTPRMLGALADAIEALADFESSDDEDGALDALEGAEDVIHEQKASVFYLPGQGSPTDTERRIVEAVCELIENRIH